MVISEETKISENTKVDSEVPKVEEPIKKKRGRKPAPKVKKSISPLRTRSQDRSLRDKKKVEPKELETAAQLLNKKTSRKKKT